MDAKNCYSIRYVANQTGLKPYIIRTWERRYAAVTPRRTETNRRIYCAADIIRLQLLRQAVNEGHTISHIAPLNTEELTRLSRRPKLKIAGKQVTGDSRSDQNDTGEIVKTALAHVLNLDPAALEKTLEGAAVILPRQRLLQSVIQPLFNEIGFMWATGKIKVINEHMASIVARSFLWDMLRSAAVAEQAPRIVVAAPAGQWHEAGALVVALTATESGWQAMYFGPNLPAEEIAAAVQKTNSRALALSICHRIDETRLALELKRIKRYVGRQVQVYVGGHEIDKLKNLIETTGAKCIDDMEHFRSELETL